MTQNGKDPVTIARRVLRTEITALETLSQSLGPDFTAIIKVLKACQGKIILSGVGKSGHVARKIAATLTSTGSIANYIHPTEASHGDMGLITRQDAVIALSRSGETRELADLIHYCNRFSIPLIAMTANADSTLGGAAHHLLLLPDAPEACAETRAPTTSTVLQMALGDAVAVALLEAKGFTASEFKTFHPGGALGASLLSVSDIMHNGARLPLVGPETKISQALDVMSAKGFGCVGVWDKKTLLGMVTDGDIRRHLSDDLAYQPVSAIMTTAPKVAMPTALAADVLRQMTSETPKVMQMFVVEEGVPVGIVHMHDFLRVGLV